MFFPASSPSPSSSCPSSSLSIGGSEVKEGVAKEEKDRIDNDTSKKPSKNNKTDDDPEFLRTTLELVQELLKNKVPEEVFGLVFDVPLPSSGLPLLVAQYQHERPHERPQRRPQRQRQRQIILNLYPPQTGITPHVDIPGKYGDGILGVCLGGGCVMTFSKVSLKEDTDDGDVDGGLWGSDEEEEEEPDMNSHGAFQTRKVKEYDVYLPVGTVYILSGESRWSWTHGIEGRGEDLVWDDDEDSSSSSFDREDQPGRTATTILRSTRVSITYRWLRSPACRKGSGSEEVAGGGILLQDLAGDGDWNVR